MCDVSRCIGGIARPGTDAPAARLGADEGGRWADGGSPMGIDREGPGCAERSAGRDRSDAASRENLIISWLRHRPGSMRGYLKYLVDSDLSLNESLQDIYACSRSDLRLALALFIDFAHEQRLGPGELAPLLTDARRDLLEAVCFVIGSALQEAQTDPEAEYADAGDVVATLPLPMAGAA